ncbi:TOBE domain-containing protein [Seleniivibrio sp.]|uniref:TOBE domain-containing protein n=1 Tax=Seleniivibrio sp. TaxID=2898801 RepID=UPI0025DFC5F9|nr:TOBE domain-containing protein [Seleniivibrio sp.]MCD8553968.1 TOBE domain-containing protein [Seleniivibrio sp.]
MNQLEAKVLHYRTSGQIILCELESFGAQVTAVILDSPGELEYLKEGNALNILFKETEVIIATGEIGQLSLNNRFRAKITAMEKGDIFTSLAIDFGTGMTSVITTKSAERLGLAVGTEVTALVKANEIAIGRRD